MRESAVRDKLLLVYGLARNRRSPKRPSEPRPSGVHPEEDEVKRDGEASPRFIVITFETRSALASYTLEFSHRLL